LNLSGHIQTIVPALFRRVENIDFFSEFISTPDGDFLELDWCLQKSDKLVILSHGLEGNTNRPYMLGMAKAFIDAGFDCLLWNFRSCGTRMNKRAILYHSGATYDLETVLKHAALKNYTQINLVGFSLGGNLTLKFLGENSPCSKMIHRAAVFSVPCHLSSAADELAKLQNKIYSNRFLKSLKKKIEIKATQFPELKIDVTSLKKISNIRSFDNSYTAPLHGFTDAEDYYRKNSALYFLNEISAPVLIVNAQNDPFLSQACYPIKEVEKNSNLKLVIPGKGGHCGFMTISRRSKAEIMALDFISKR
jgi:uncharacterized protein